MWTVTLEISSLEDGNCLFWQTLLLCRQESSGDGMCAPENVASSLLLLFQPIGIVIRLWNRSLNTHFCFLFTLCSSKVIQLFLRYIFDHNFAGGGPNDLIFWLHSKNRIFRRPYFLKQLILTNRYQCFDPPPSNMLHLLHLLKFDDFFNRSILFCLEAKKCVEFTLTM